MWFVVVGCLLLALKVADINPVAGLSWLWVLSPFAGAVIWWSWADGSGLTRKREMDKLMKRQEERRRKNMVSLGIDPRQDKRTRVFKQKRAEQVQQVEAQRDQQRQKNREAISSFHPESRQGQEGPGRGTSD